MRILFIAPSLPNTYHRVRSHHLLKSLTETHEVHLIAFHSDQDAARVSADIVARCASVHVVRQSYWQGLRRALFHAYDLNTPAEAFFCATPEMIELVDRIARKVRPDLVYVKRLRMAAPLPEVFPYPVIIDSTDAMSLYYRLAFSSAPWHKRLAYAHEYLAYTCFEQQIARRFSHWVVCAEDDAAFLRLCGVSNVSIVPNVIDTNYFRFYPRLNHHNEPIILISGLMDKQVNTTAVIWFVEEVWWLITRLFPYARLRIVGPNPTRSIRRLTRIPGVDVIGDVFDLRQELQQSHVVVVPTRLGTGTSNKILQAWAGGVPIVSTSLGARGFDYHDGTHLLVADDSELFSDAVCTLLLDDSLSQKFAVAARAHVEEKYSIPALSRALDEVVHQGVTSHDPASPSW